MPSLNRVFLIGNLTRDPELRYTPIGTAVVNLRLAINRRFRDKSGELRQDVCYVTVVTWNKQAELCNQYLQKGKPIFVEGRLQFRSFEDANGNKRNVLEVRAGRIQFLGPPAGQAGPPSTGTGSFSDEQETPSEESALKDEDWMNPSQETDETEKRHS
ncbi:MAG: single-stranded DNA-binding protein [Candidatus Omnitrophica bacterium]|nr:single-stranded DNA-binding protein [Candidatus Omnitrophota bacterium]